MPAGGARRDADPSHPGLYKPDYVNPRYETDTAVGDFDGAFAAAAVRVDATYRTPAEHNHPMEPHATIAAWQGDTLTLYDATQGPSRAAGQIAAVFGLEPGGVRVIAEHVGGGFGAKGMPRANVVLAAMAARVIGRPVKCAVTRQQMFAVTGHRAPSIQRVRLGAGPDGRLVALCHDVFDQTSTLKEFTEQSAVATRHMYAAPQPAHHSPRGPARRADAVLDASAGGVPGDVRPGIGHGRAGRGLRHRPGGIADTE